MGLENYRDEIDEHLENVESGNLVIVPNALDRVDESYNLLPSRYTLISGATGSGKTSFMDHSFILNPFMYFKENDIDDVHWEILYFSLERKSLFKKFKWISWLMYVNEGLIHSAEYLLGYKKEKPDAKLLAKIREYKNSMLEDLLDHVTLLDGKTKSDTIINMIRRKALQLGTFYQSDDIGVSKNHSGIYDYTFDHSNTRTTRRKGEEVFIEIEHDGQTFTLTQNSHRYFYKYKKSLIFIMLDGINLIGEKEDIDKVSEILANARDLYGFSPVVVTQQNRSQSNIDRLKLHGSSMGPQMEDIYKSSQMAFDCDLALGLFDPYYFKAYDAKGMVGGYQIQKGGTMSPQGFSRFRSLHIMKNSFGYAGKRYGMKFLGETGDFLVLPLPEKDPIELEKIYYEIANGK